MKSRNPAVKYIRPKVTEDERRDLLEKAIKKIEYYINEDPETKVVFERLKDR